MRADAYDDFLARDAEDEAWLKKLPKCAYCNKPIQDEKCLRVNDEFYHTDCFIAEHEVKTEEYTEYFEYSCD